MTEQESSAPRRFTRRQKLAGALGTTASVATILTLIITLGSSSSSSQAPQPPVSVATQYPAAVQDSFLSSCEVNGTAAMCSCELSWFEVNVPFARFEADDALANQGQVPADATSATAACA